MKKKARLFFIKHLSIIGIILFAAFIRFFNFPHNYGFDGDATRDAIIALEGATHPYFPLAGAFSSTGPFTFGPWYYASLIATDILFRTTFSPWILMTVMSLVTVVVMYDIGRVLKSKKLGYLLSGLAALAPSEFIASNALSNLTPVPVFAALTLWSSIRIIQSSKPSFWWFLALGVFLGLGINAHYQMAGLLLLPLLVWFFSSSRNLKTAISLLVGLSITFVPLFIFNLTHNWHTVRGVLEMYASRDRIYVANSWKLYLGQFWPSLIQFIFGTPFLLSAILLLLVPLTLVWDMVRKTIPKGIAVPAIVLFANLVQLRFYWGERSFPYHFYLVPLILLLVGYMLY
ncbi:MAG: glycosyltransferase family 39 protein, partial [Candidatus Levyibacteriota bacterium]